MTACTLFCTNNAPVIFASTSAADGTVVVAAGDGDGPPVFDVCASARCGAIPRKHRAVATSAGTIFLMTALLAAPDVSQAGGRQETCRCRAGWTGTPVLSSTTVPAKP